MARTQKQAYGDGASCRLSLLLHPRRAVGLLNRRPFSLGRRRFYPWWFALVVTLAVTGFYSLEERWQSPEILLSVIGSVAAFFHFLYAQHNSNTDRFVSLFQDFNARYDKLNDRLNRIVLRTSEPIVTPEDLQSLYDYFNLCGEEYLYFKAGYIDRDVWLSWVLGMRYFAAHLEVRGVWQRELEQGSYYGFSLSLLDAADTQETQVEGWP